MSYQLVFGVGELPRRCGQGISGIRDMFENITVDMFMDIFRGGCAASEQADLWMQRMGPGKAALGVRRDCESFDYLTYS
jgi:hypothetical protein